MLFNSLEFLLFFPAVAGLYFAVPQRFRWALLLVASYVFYMAWEPWYLLLILTSTLVDYVAGRLLGIPRRSRALRTAILTGSLVTNLGLLFVFKYYNFFARSFEALTATLGLPFSLPVSHLLLPVGISFYTFQTLSYTIEVYRGRQEPERHLGRFALYVSFFPQLVAGPIERSYNLLPQLRRFADFDYHRVKSGLLLMAWGFFKKVVIADRLAGLVDTAYADTSSFTGFEHAVAAVAFGYQIYCDFSGYTDIARGAAAIFKISLMENFRLPYLARSIPEFWHRWHISLSTWFGDYLYIPLGGNRVPKPAWTFNILVVFLLSGIWHGASWTFAVWGLLHATYYLASRYGSDFRKRAGAMLGLDRTPRLTHVLQVGTTFSLVTFAWIFFRASSIADAFQVVGRLHSGWDALLGFTALRASLVKLGLTPTDYLIVAGSVLVLEAVEIVAHRTDRHPDAASLVVGFPPVVRWACYYGLVFAILLFGVFNRSQFIYFQF